MITSTRTRIRFQRAAARATILDSAREILALRGHQSFTMRGLAAAIGCAPGTLYLYFRNREDLLECLVEDAFAKLLEILEQVDDDLDPVRSLKNKLRAYVDFGLRFPHHYQFAFLIRRAGERARAPLHPHAAFDLLRRAVTRCVEERSLRWPEVETTSQILWATIHGITSLLIVRPHFPWVDRDRLVDQLLDTAINGLG
jgi:AcrR family transcriptional regulator